MNDNFYCTFRRTHNSYIHLYIIYNARTTINLLPLLAPSQHDTGLGGELCKSLGWGGDGRGCLAQFLLLRRSFTCFLPCQCQQIENRSSYSFASELGFLLGLVCPCVPSATRAPAPPLHNRPTLVSASLVA